MPLEPAQIAERGAREGGGGERGQRRFAWSQMLGGLGLVAFVFFCLLTRDVDPIVFAAIACLGGMQLGSGLLLWFQLRAKRSATDAS